MQSQKFDSDSQRQPALVPTKLRHPLMVLGLVSTLGIITAEAIVPSAQAASLTNWNFDPSSNQLELAVQDGTTPRYFLMARPARIVVDLPDTSVGPVTAQRSYLGAIRQIRVSQFQPGLTRIVMELSPDVALAPGQVQLQKIDQAKPTGSRWMIRPLIADSRTGNTVNQARALPPTATAKTNSSSNSNSHQNTATVKVPPLQSPQSNSPLSTPSQKEPTPPASETSRPNSAATTPNQIPNRTVAAPKPVATPAKLPSAKPAAPAIAAKEPEPPATPSASSLPPAPPSRKIQAAAPQQEPAPPASASLPSEVDTSQTADPEIAVNTAGAVSIAVPPPTAIPTPSLTAPAPINGAAVRSRLAPTLDKTGKPIAPQAGPAIQPVAPATPKTTPTVQQAVKPSISNPSNLFPVSNAPASLEIPSTLVVLPSSPTVNVPPLTRQDITSTPVSNTAPNTSAPNQEVSLTSDLLPSTLATKNQSVQITVPQLGATAQLSQAPGTTPSISDSASTPMPPATSLPTVQSNGSMPTVSVPALKSNAVPAPTVNVPPLQPASSQVVPKSAPINSGAGQVFRPTQPTVVEFGQPLPSSSAPRSRNYPAQSQIDRSSGLPQVLTSSAPNILLPAGTLLNLQYPGGQALNLRTNSPHQEVLLLQTEVRDAFGKIIAPEGSRVLGRFETSSSGSRFVTQAIALQGRNIPLVAQSDTLAGDRKISDNQMVVNSGIGAVAGGVIGGLGGSAGLGVLGGAAAGAAATLLTSPKPAVIQPGQVVQVRLLQDLR